MPVLPRRAEGTAPGLGGGGADVRCALVSQAHPAGATPGSELGPALRLPG